MKIRILKKTIKAYHSVSLFAKFDLAVEMIMCYNNNKWVRRQMRIWTHNANIQRKYRRWRFKGKNVSPMDIIANKVNNKKHIRWKQMI